MNCTISGQTPENPVVSKKTGHLYERRLIEKLIDEEGKCPITGEELTVDDLIELKTIDSTVKPRTLPSTSIPGILSLLQNEWDDLMLETYTLKKHLNSTREELSHALYQYDASCRVIARITQERDQAREQIITLQKQLANGGSNQSNGTSQDQDTMDVDSTGFSDTLVSAVQQKAKELSKYRKHERAVSKSLCTEEKIQSYEVVASSTPHRSDKPGILCVQLSPRDSSHILSGGVDKTAVLTHRQTGKILATLTGHKKQVNTVGFHPSSEVICTGSSDSTLRLWHGNDLKYNVAHVISDHTNAVTGCSIHPTGDYVSTSSKDGSWGMMDIRTGRCLRRLFLSNEESQPSNVTKVGLTDIEFHPDGAIVATSTENSVVRIWDVVSQSNVATFEGHSKSVNSISFSENGYHMASGAEDGTVRLWDLRKLKNFLTLEVENDTVDSVAFDYSGTYLSVGHHHSISIYKEKSKREWNLVKTFNHHKARVTDVQCGDDMNYFVSTSMDRSLKVFSLDE